MKKKNWITELILAVIFIAATASAGGVYYTPLMPKTFECLVFEIDLHQLRAVEAVDEKGSKYIHTDFVPRKLTEVFYYRHTSGGIKTAMTRCQTGGCGACGIEDAAEAMENLADAMVDVRKAWERI